MNEQQIERFRKIVQEIATDESISFDEAFAIAANHLAYWVSEMPKGKQAVGCSSEKVNQAGRNQADQSLD